jgi:hypothetical protein
MEWNEKIYIYIYIYFKIILSFPLFENLSMREREGMERSFSYLRV